MQGGHVLIAMAVVDQIQFQLFHQRRDGKIELDGPGCLEGDAEILAMQAEPKAERIAAMQHGCAAVLEGPGPRGTVFEGIDHLGHRQIQLLAKGHRLRHGGVAAGHQNLVHRLYLLPPPHAPEVVDGASNDLKDRPNPLQCLASSSHQHREAAAFGTFRAAGDGGTEGAKRGSLTVLVGGASEALERVRPILEVIGGSIHHFGSVGRGQQVKAVNQVLVAGSYAAVAEAVALGQQLDLPMPQVIDALKNGAAGSWALEHRSAAMLNSSYPLGFRLSLHRKDLGIALEAARAVQIDLPVTTLVEQLELDLINNGHGDEDVSALHRWNQKRGNS